MTMIERSLRLEPLRLASISTERQLETAREVLRLLRHDTLHVSSGDEAAACSVADPDSDEKVQEQLQLMHRLTAEGARYDRVVTDHFDGSDITQNMAGVVSTGPWQPSDDEIYGHGKVRQCLGRVGQALTRPEMRPVGLHTLAVRKGLMKAALLAVRHQRVPYTASLIAHVDTRDTELKDAFRNIGASENGPVGERVVQGHVVASQRFFLPSLASEHTQEN